MTSDKQKPKGRATSLDQVRTNEELKTYLSSLYKVDSDLKKDHRLQAQRYGEISWKCAVWESKLAELTIDLKLMFDDLRREALNPNSDLPRGRGGTPTKETIEAFILRDTDYRKKLKEANNVKFLISVLNGAMKALDHKGDALMNLSADERREHGTD